MKCCYYPDRDAVNLCSKCGKGLCMECVCGSPPGLPGGLSESAGEDTLEKTYLSVVFICLFFAGVVFGLSSVYVQGGNRISTMFSALAVRNIMPGVPSGCFTGSFWYGGIQCTVFPFFTDILIVGAHAALSSWVNLWARLCQTFHYSFPGGCEPSDYMDMLRASFCREGSSRIAGRIYSIIFLLKYIKHPVFQNNSIHFILFFC